MRTENIIHISDLHLGDQINRGVHERFKRAFQALVDMAINVRAQLRFVGDTFEQTSTMFGCLHTEEESDSFRRELVRYYYQTQFVPEFLEGNHDPYLADELDQYISEIPYTRLPAIYSSEKESTVVTHGHFLGLRRFRELLRKNESDITALNRSLSEDPQIQRVLQKTERNLRSWDAIWRLLHRTAPRVSLARMDLVDAVVQKRIVPAQLTRHERGRSKHPALEDSHRLLESTDSWALIRGHHHSPYLHLEDGKIIADCGSFLSRAHKPTAVVVDVEQKALALLEFAGGEWGEEKLTAVPKRFVA